MESQWYQWNKYKYTYKTNIILKKKNPQNQIVPCSLRKNRFITYIKTFTFLFKQLVPL